MMAPLPVIGEFCFHHDAAPIPEASILYVKIYRAGAWARSRTRPATSSPISLVLMEAGYDGYGYAIMRRQGGTWRHIYHGGGFGC
jgi:hypothetical protein